MKPITKKILRMFFCIPKDCKVTKIDIQIMIYQFIGSVLVGGYCVYIASGRI